MNGKGLIKINWIFWLESRGLLKWIPDKIYLSIVFGKIMGKKIDFNNPQTFNEKLQYLKLYDRNPLYCTLVDKLEVKKYIEDKLGKQYVIPYLGRWDSPDDININLLPDKFIIKCTHDSGSYSICKNKSVYQWDSEKEKLKKGMKSNFFWIAREWPYKSIKPHIIAEKYVVNDDSIPEEEQELSDYKFYCFNGYVDCVMICYDRASGDTKFYFFDKDWKLKRINKRGKEAPANFTLPKPDCLDEMFRIASELSKGIPFVRVDLYQCNKKVYFGEMTFYPQGGWDPNYLPETDEYFGKLIDLNIAYSNKHK